MGAMRAATTNPAKKVFRRRQNNIGSSQFHKSRPTSPPIATKAAVAMIARGASQIHFFLILCSSFFLDSSRLPKLVVNALQSFAQVQRRVALAGEQRVDAHAAFCRQLFEAAPLQFVSDEYLTLLVGQFVERKFQLIQKQGTDVKRLRPCIGRWQQVFDLQPLAIFVLDRGVAEALRPLLAEKVCDAVAR